METAEQVFLKYYNGTYRYLRGLCADEQLAQKLAQDTFLRASTNINNYNGSMNIKTWLSLIIKNQYHSYMRTRSRMSGKKLEEYLKTEHNRLCDMIEDKDLADRLYGILKSLPDPFGEVYMLHVFGEMSFAEIGAVNEKSEQWACTVFYRAKLMIDDIIAGGELASERTMRYCQGSSSDLYRGADL